MHVGAFLLIRGDISTILVSKTMYKIAGFSDFGPHCAQSQEAKPGHGKREAGGQTAANWRQKNHPYREKKVVRGTGFEPVTPTVSR